MAKTTHPKVLLVEGDRDIWIILRLIEGNGITWEKDEDRDFHIEYPGYPNKQGGGIDQLLKPKFIASYLIARKCTVLGLVVDADVDASRRWQQVKDACRRSIPDMPDELPEAGLIHDTQNSVRDPVKFGVWIMPDNKTCGMIETFLANLIRDERKPLWQYAQEVANTAKMQGAPFTEAHRDKANIHSWLAWQDPPGLELHQAVMKQVFDSQHPKVQAFMTWFRNLYDL